MELSQKGSKGRKWSCETRDSRSPVHAYLTYTYTEEYPRYSRKKWIKPFSDLVKTRKIKHKANCLSLKAMSFI